MNDSEFRKWPKTKRFLDVQMTVTQKMEGTNAQIVLDEGGGIVLVGSRNIELSYEQDNFGFYAWCSENSEYLFSILGPGRHYGEWCGPGIQNGEGLRERKFFSFNPYWLQKDSLDLIEPVPLLYQGRVDLCVIYDILCNLEKNGSAVNGFKPAEGVIINFGGTRYKVYLDNIDAIEELITGERYK